MVDFDLPYTFFPSHISRYFPYIEAIDREYEVFNQSETRNKKVIRAVAVVAQATISDSEELFADYIKDERIEPANTPDWLIEPPEPSIAPYLEKKEMISEVPFPVKLMIMYHQAKRGRTYEDFEGRIKYELVEDQQKERVKLT